MGTLLKMKLFLNTLDNFLDFIQDTFPEFDTDLVITKQAINMTKASNPRVVIEQFMNYIGPYTSQIENCDEGFFLDIDNIKDDIGSENLDFAIKLKKIWTSNGVTLEQKAKIWWYFQNLLKYGLKIT